MKISIFKAPFFFMFFMYARCDEKIQLKHPFEPFKKWMIYCFTFSHTILWIKQVCFSFVSHIKVYLFSIEYLFHFIPSLLLMHSKLTSRTLFFSYLFMNTLKIISLSEHERMSIELFKISIQNECVNTKCFTWTSTLVGLWCANWNFRGSWKVF
jgi:hypothetical protein